MKNVKELFYVLLLSVSTHNLLAQVQTIDSMSAATVPTGSFVTLYVSGLPSENPNDIHIQCASNPIPGVGIVVKRNPGTSTAHHTVQFVAPSSGSYEYVTLSTSSGTAVSPERLSVVSGCNQTTDISSFSSSSSVYASLDPIENAQCVSVADMDQDGNPDIVSGWSSTCGTSCDGFIRIDFGDGSSRTIATTATVSSLHIVDMNADGISDIISMEERLAADTTMPDTTYLNIYMVEAAASEWQTFPPIVIPVFQQGKSTQVTRSNISNNRTMPIDLDSDGYMDLVFASCDITTDAISGGSLLDVTDPLQQVGELRVWQLMQGQTASFEFQERYVGFLFDESDSITEPGDTSIVLENIDITLGDYDGDNEPDIGVAVAINVKGTGADKNRVMVVTYPSSSSSCGGGGGSGGTGGDCFDMSAFSTSKKEFKGHVTLLKRELASGDLNADGFDELVLCAGDSVYIITPDSSGGGGVSSSSITTLDITAFAGYDFNGAQCSIGDINSDGSPDLVFAGSGDGISPPQIIAYQNRSGFHGTIDGTLSILGSFPPSMSVTDMSMSDINSDGNTDIVSLHRSSSGSSIEEMISNQSCNDIPPPCISSCSVQGNNVVIHGSFNPGNYSFPQPLRTQPYAPTAAYSPLEYSTTGATGTYVIADEAGLYSSIWCGVATVSNAAGSKGMICNSRSSGKSSLWGQEVPILPSTTYTFSVFVNNPICTSTNKPDPKIQLLVNGVAITTALTVTEMPDNWIQLTGVWISGENPVKTATIEIVNTKTGANGNDIMLDDISFIGCSPEISIYAGADISMCNGSSVELHADITTPDGGDYTISWSPPTGLSSTTIANPICTSTKTRTYTAIATFSDGTSCSATDQVKVSVAANPTASITVSGPLTVCVGSCVSLSTTAVSGSSYRWLLNGADAPGTNTGASYSACSTGNYALLVTNAAGCSQLSNTVYAQVITCKEGEDLFATSDMSLYPNPANNNITMNYVSQNNAAARVRFLGISGAVVYEMNYEMKGGINDLLMDISMLEAGIYIAEIQSGSNVSFGKFVKM